MAEKKTVYELIPQLGKLRDEVLFGDVWEQPELSKRDRSLATCAVLIALYRTQELRGHMARDIVNGVTKEEMFGLIHNMRARIIKSPAFTGDRVLGAILFERTMDQN